MSIQVKNVSSSGEIIRESFYGKRSSDNKTVSFTLPFTLSEFTKRCANLTFMDYSAGGAKGLGTVHNLYPLIVRILINNLSDQDTIITDPQEIGYQSTDMPIYMETKLGNNSSSLSNIVTMTFKNNIFSLTYSDNLNF